MTTLDQTKKKMTAAIEHLQEELKSIRTGRANPAMVEGVMVEAYGEPMPLKKMASISVPEARQLLLTPFDANLKGAISKAIGNANLGLLAIVDGNAVRVKVPPMDDNQRKEMGKLCHKKSEETKVTIRNIRREANEELKGLKKGGMSEDELKRLEKQVQELTDKFCKEAEELAVKKEKEIMTI